MLEIETARPATDQPKKLFRTLELSYQGLPPLEPSAFFAAVLERTREHFGEECGITDSGLFRADRDGWRRENGSAGLAAALPPSQPPRDPASPGVVFLAFPFPAAVWFLGERHEFAAVFRLCAPAGNSAAFILEIARVVVGERHREASWSGMMDRALEIQRSLLPNPLPSLAGFELAARSDPAEKVGGDVYDVTRLAPGVLGLMIADASGHGLPAALESRDVVIGLRMGAAHHLKIESTVERLNRILCASTLSSRFVSVVYGEIAADGGFDYVNAGHPAPFVVSTSREITLPDSGPVLGVFPDSIHRVRRAYVPPGGLLVLYTDGVTECPSPEGEEFGLDRLRGVVRALFDAPVDFLASAIFEALREHARLPDFPDDASVLLVRRTGNGPATSEDFHQDPHDSAFIRS